MKEYAAAASENVLSAIIRNRCPRCRRGYIFSHGPFSAKFQAMHEDCPFCGQHYEVEPGFFWGSMYITYGTTVFIIGFVIAGLYYLIGHLDNLFVYVAAVLGALLLTTSFNYRAGRILMLYMFGFIKFDKQASLLPGKYHRVSKFKS